MLNSYLRSMAVVPTAVAGLVFVGGCHHDIWALNYEPNPAAAGLKSVEMAEPPRVREVTPEQVKQAVEIEQKFLDEHSMRREDETLVEQMQLQEQLFHVFKVREDAGLVVRLGECDFTYDEPVLENDPRLVHLGQHKGATVILLCLFPKQKADGPAPNVSHDAWGGGASWADHGDYAVAAQFFRRLTPEEQEQIKAKKP
jgi:hypothetical protein